LRPQAALQSHGQAEEDNEDEAREATEASQPLRHCREPRVTESERPRQAVREIVIAVSE